jgi:hypothetical protein
VLCWIYIGVDDFKRYEVNANATVRYSMHDSVLALFLPSRGRRPVGRRRRGGRSAVT